MISATTIDQINDLAIADVVGKYVDLKKSGANYCAPSPFTDEKTPSFFVVPSKNIFKCFSSGKGGSAITFVMEKVGLNYPDAIKEIAGQFNIQVEYEQNGHPPEHYDELERLYTINHAAARRYAEQFHNIRKIADHPAVHELVDKRKFTDETIVQWQIGYAPGDVSGEYTPAKWNFLSSKIVLNGYYEQAIELGLIKTKNQDNYDTFRHRIMFPIIDHAGRYAGFGGRALQSDGMNPKYLNSDDSRIFNKSKILYGLNFAIQAIRKKGYANITEGYTDVISFHQAGLDNTVGTCGTALTEDQCKLLRKYTDKAVLFYDGDDAGQRAAMRAIDILIKCKFQPPMVVPMPSIVTVKAPQPTEETPGPLPIDPFHKEIVFITQRNRETIFVRHNNTVHELALDRIEAIEKVDPDELVRMFA